MIEEKDRLLSLLKYEAEKNYCREVVTIAQGQNLKMGTIVGEKTADGTYKQVSLSTQLMRKQQLMARKFQSVCCCRTLMQVQQLSKD